MKLEIRDPFKQIHQTDGLTSPWVIELLICRSALIEPVVEVFGQKRKNVPPPGFIVSAGISQALRPMAPDGRQCDGAICTIRAGYRLIRSFKTGREAARDMPLAAFADPAYTNWIFKKGLDTTFTTLSIKGTSTESCTVMKRQNGKGLRLTDAHAPPLGKPTPRPVNPDLLDHRAHLNAGP